MKLLINSLTYGRIMLGPIIFGILIFSNSYFAALLLFLMASISDYFDGFLARRYNLSSELGEILDPIADKILILFIFFALTVHLESAYIGFSASIILAREFWVSALRDFNARTGNTHATKVSFMAKLKTTAQLITLAMYLFAISLDSKLLIFIADFSLFASLILTIQTGLQYSLASFKKS